ncbi:MAG: hypothetical protein KAX51_07585, partial [Chromatiaceae bacterium]|nr:hypothetical protein [Chromatiaceae bacterium]
LKGRIDRRSLMTLRWGYPPGSTTLWGSQILLISSLSLARLGFEKEVCIPIGDQQKGGKQKSLPASPAKQVV